MPLLDIRQIVARAGNPDWTRDGTNRIVYDTPDRNDGTGGTTWYRVWTANPDGSDAQPYGQSYDVWTGQGAPAGTIRHMGNAKVSPDGQWVLLQVQRYVSGQTVHEASTPGQAYRNDLWVGRRDGSAFWRVYAYDQEARLGCLQPRWNHAGTELAWANMVETADVGLGRPYGAWEVKRAGITFPGSVPTLGATTTYTPGTATAATRFYEAHGFTPDDTALVFSGNTQGQAQAYLDLCTLRLSDQLLTRLTTTSGTSGERPEWDEHGRPNPAGTRYLWATSQLLDTAGGKLPLELWRMNLDGSAKQRVTYCNDPRHPQWLGTNTPGYWTLAPSAWSPNGNEALVVAIDKAQSDPLTGSGPLLRLFGVESSVRFRPARASVVRTAVARTSVARGLP